MLPFGISIIDLVIVLVFVFQILWGARLGFAMAAFSLAAEVIGIIAAVIYTPTVADLINHQFHVIAAIDTFVASHSKLPLDLVQQYNFGQTVLQTIVFFGLYIIVQSALFYAGRTVHHQIGIRRMTYLSSSFFGMFIGVLKATLEVMFFLIAWNIVTADPNVHAALEQLGALSNFAGSSKLLPIFQSLVPAASPIAKYF